MTALSLVSLVEVAWADGSLDDNEPRVLLEWAGTSGLAPGSTERTLLAEWLMRKPDPKLLTAWTHLIQGLCQQMSREEVAALKAGLPERARTVAGASGGFLRDGVEGVGRRGGHHQAARKRVSGHLVRGPVLTRTPRPVSAVAGRGVASMFPMVLKEFRR